MNSRKYSGNLIKIERILRRYTDQTHGLTVKEIGRMAVDEGEIPIDRKTLYRHFADMRDIGIDIKLKRQGRGISYYIDSKFTADELVFVIEQVENGYSRSKASHLKKELLSLVSIYQEQEVLKILKANKKRRAK